MNIDDRRLQVEITLVPAKGRNGSQRRRPSGPKVPDPRIPRIARLMALAIKFQDMVHRGQVRDYADLARLGYVSRARLTQIMNLLLLAPDLQESLLALVDAVEQRARLSERSLRKIGSPQEFVKHSLLLGFCGLGSAAGPRVDRGQSDSSSMFKPLQNSSPSRNVQRGFRARGSCRRIAGSLVVRELERKLALADQG